MKASNASDVKLMITPLFGGAKGATQHILLELSHRLAKRLQENTIHLTGIIVDKHKIFYKDAEYGSNLVSRHSNVHKAANLKGGEVNEM